MSGEAYGVRDKGGNAMSAFAAHFHQHPFHLLACGVAALLVVAAIVLGAPVLAILGGLMCGVMMIGMVWMMFAMASKARH